MEHTEELINELIEKFGDLLVRSELRVDNINKMITNLIEQNRMIHERLQACNDIVKREQETTHHLLDVINQKDTRINYLESVLDRYINIERNNNQNNFNMK